jgi:caa(3)-type oxidase subunit IV
MHTDTASVKKSIRTYLMIGVALLVFTGITVAANLVHLPVHWAITVAMIIASIKASMVAAIFMHLNHERQWIYGSLLLTVAFFVVLMTIPIFTNNDHIGTPVHIKRAPAADHGAAGEHGGGH